MQRILVIGASGAGKSTLAAELARRLDLPFFPSDPFYWEPGWKPAPAETVLRRLDEVLARERWVLDGNFDDQRKQVWTRAECVVWLDYSLATIASRSIRRNLGLLLNGGPTWSGNRMNAARAFSGIRHAFRSYGLKRRVYPGWLADLTGVEVHRLRSPRETEAWTEALLP